MSVRFIIFSVKPVYLAIRKHFIVVSLITVVFSTDLYGSLVELDGIWRTSDISRIQLVKTCWARCTKVESLYLGRCLTVRSVTFHKPSCGLSSFPQSNNNKFYFGWEKSINFRRIKVLRQVIIPHYFVFIMKARLFSRVLMDDQRFLILLRSSPRTLTWVEGNELLQQVVHRFEPLQD